LATAAAMAFAGVAPTLTVGADVYITPAPATITITGAVPLVDNGEEQIQPVQYGHGPRRQPFIRPFVVDVLTDDEEVLLMLYAA